MARVILENCKRDILDVYKHAIEAVRPERLVRQAIEIRRDVLIVKDSLKANALSIDLRNKNVHVIGGGKSALGMAVGLSQIFANSENVCQFTHGALSIPYGLKHECQGSRPSQDALKYLRIRCNFGSENNLPDTNSVEASRILLDEIAQACAEDMKSNKQPLFIVLISGGGSACLTSPRLISLKTKLGLIKHLVQRGADIVELNSVRRCFSDVKGGRLARFISREHPDSTILTIIISDVIGDHVEFIASGPTVVTSDALDGGYVDQLRAVLTKYQCPDTESLLQLLKIPSESEYRYPINVHNFVIGSNKIARDAALDRARYLGYHVLTSDHELSGTTGDVMREIVRRGKSVETGNYAKLLAIYGGEAVVEKQLDESWGKGGRAQEMAIDYMIDQLSSGSQQETTEEYDVFLAGGTDGQDGPTDVAGCLASHREYKINDCDKFSLDELRAAKKTHNSHEFWRRNYPEWLIETGLTGTNVMDLYMHLRFIDRLSNKL